jgi:pimeloyl-ACP methyl ester carboxylesterase
MRLLRRRCLLWRGWVLKSSFQDYGIVLCGHSLGGGVAALLATMISEPNPSTAGDAWIEVVICGQEAGTCGGLV